MNLKYLVLILAGIVLFVGSDAVAQSQAGILTSARASGSSNLVYTTPTVAGADMGVTAEAPFTVYSRGVTPVAYYYGNHHWYRYHHPHSRLCRTRGWVSGHYNQYGKWVRGHHYCKLWA
jgi:hypothetical protein